MNTSTRNRYHQDVQRAYEIQTRAGIEGAGKGMVISAGLATIGHYTWPFFRRQSLPFKGFLVTISAVTGLIFGAESALLAHEAERRQEETMLRRQARFELAKQGLIATETEIGKWRAANGR